MLELQAGVGFGGAARQFYQHHRTLILSAVLSVAGLGTGTATAFAASQGIAFVDAGLIAAGVILAAAVSLWHTRHLGLALMTALAPLPGLLWAAPASGGAAFGAVPALAYGLGFAAAVFTAENVITRVLDVSRRVAPWRAAFSAVLLSGILAALWFHGTVSADAALQAVCDGASAVASVFVLLPLGSDILHFDEAFVARANRARERRARLWERIANVTIPRWAFAFSGVAIVFLALGWYGSEPAMRAGLYLKAGSVVSVLAAAILVAGNWRKGIAIALVLTVAALTALWAMAMSGRANAVGLLEIVAFALFLALHGARRSGTFMRAGDPALIAERRMVEGNSAAGFAAIGALAAVLPGAVFWPGGLSLAAGLAAGSLAVIVLVPAVAAALEILIPRRVSVEELFGQRKKAEKA